MRTAPVKAGVPGIAGLQGPMRPAAIGLASRKVLALIALAAALPATVSAQSFSRQTLDAQFYSEGVHAADIDRDGVVDVIAGPYWYKGPAFTQKTAFRTPRATPFPVTGDSDCYAIFTHDFNGDAWPDILTFRLGGGAEAVWYQNPGATGVASWAEHVAFSPVQNESPAFADVDGDGKPEIVTNSGGKGGWAAPDWSAPNNAWTFRSVTPEGSSLWGAFTHGTGVGDVNKDGRLDILFPEGWLEQPATPGATPWTHHPAAFWGKELPGEGYGGAQMHVYDVDGDGDNDVITSLQAHGWGLAWFEQVDTGFVKRMIVNTRADTALYGVAFPQIHAIAVADLDGDGLHDIVAGNRRGAHGNGLPASELNGPAVLYWFKLVRPATGLPRFEPRLIDTASGIGTQITIADVTGDGRPDILTSARRGTFVFKNEGASSIRPGRGSGFSSPSRNDFVKNDRDAAGRKRVAPGGSNESGGAGKACRECLAPAQQ